MGKVEAGQGTKPWNRLEVLRLGFPIRDIDDGHVIRLSVHMGHVAAVCVLCPVEREGGHLVMLPGINRVERCLTPIKSLVCGVIGRPIDEHNEFFILGPDEALPNAIPDQVTEWVVIGKYVNEDDSCKRAIAREVKGAGDEQGRARILRVALRLLWILSWFQVTTSSI